MKYSKIKTLLYISLLFPMSAFGELKLKPHKGEECGIKDYHLWQHRDCITESNPIQFADKLIEERPIYHTSMSCPGSSGGTQITTVSVSNIYIERAVRENNLNSLCPSSHPRYLSRNKVPVMQGTQMVVCSDALKPARCPTGEVEKIYEKIEIIPSCKNKSAPIHYRCELYKTARELDAYLEENMIELEEKVDEVLIRQHQYLEKTLNVELLACTIMGFNEKDPTLFKDAITELEMLYLDASNDMFNEDDWLDFDCETTTDIANSKGETCDNFSNKKDVYTLMIQEGLSSDDKDFYFSCYKKFGLSESLAWFVDTLKDIEILKQDISKRKSVWSEGISYIESLEELSNSVKVKQNVFKKD